ncbi:metallophosphoesterase [Phyllobacterium sp. SB3]|uniref:metallophosphoesterase family protein n=1 Tax=Phyllobacterium sp. SB3 TaxID=3156073 RepID=UPI0032AEE7B9
MSSSKFPRIAVIADAHFHDLYGDYDFEGVEVDGGRMVARRLTDTLRSTRVFNESYYALRGALDDVVARDIKLVVLLGDYSDDGQISTLSALKQLLDRYSCDHGLVFIGTTGNHDIVGPSGRHHAKRFLNADGTYTTVASDSEFVDEDAEAMVFTDKMYCLGYPEGLGVLPDLGFFSRTDAIYWETPFGTNSEAESRLYTVCSADGLNEYQLMDASYLVEPVPNLWLLMIDANVFEPRNGDVPRDSSAAFIDSTNAGWNAMLVHKPFILEWMKDVSARAKLEGKTLLTFSHYPMIDMMDGTTTDEQALLGNTSSVARTPSVNVAAAVIKAGISVHFSGHLHVNDTASTTNDDGTLTNIGVPSLVAFPPAFKILTIENERLDVATISLDYLPIDAEINRQYRTEIAVTKKHVGSMLDARNYGEFLSGHVDQLLVHRYLKREWPANLVQAVKLLNLGDLFRLARSEKTLTIEDVVLTTKTEHANAMNANLEALDSISALDLLGDWYRLRMGSEMAMDWISPDRLAMYRLLIDAYAVAPASGAGEARQIFATIFRMMASYMAGLPSRNFTVSLETGKLTGQQN